MAGQKGEAVFGSLGRKSLLVYLHKSNESLPDNQEIMCQVRRKNRIRNCLVHSLPPEPSLLGRLRSAAWLRQLSR